MVSRARLTAPPPEPRQVWPWHSVTSASISVRQLTLGDRRMEAETYLSRGHSLREAIKSPSKGWKHFGDVADVTQPNRLKSILVAPGHGTPFLAATQVFDVRPVPRKFLALGKVEGAEGRFVKDGTILVTRSGSVGRAILAYAPHRGAVISDDLLRVHPKDPGHHGWLYAFLQAPQVRDMMTGAHYGHIIKHLETSHLAALPIPTVSKATAESFLSRTTRILSLRNEAYTLAAKADARFASAIGPIESDATENGFTVHAANIAKGRRRLEASFYVPEAEAIVRRFEKVGKVDRLESVTQRIWWMPRFKRFYGPKGMPYLSADALFTLNGWEGKRILVSPSDNHRDYFVQSGWIVMACSGQVYGLNGEATLTTPLHENVFFSHDIIRIVPRTGKVRAGYLLVTLTHRTLGRPVLIRAAYGTSIPHLDPGDVADFPVVRLGSAIESEIADLAEAAADKRSEADALEREIARDAGGIIDSYIRGMPVG